MNTDELQVIEDRIARMVEAAQESDAVFALALDTYRQHSLQDIRGLIADVRTARQEIERLQAENADLRLLLERVCHDELTVQIALRDTGESLEEEREIKQALWAIASVDLTEEQIEEWACTLDKRVKAEIANLRVSDD